jgi:hypothetical protein
MVSDAPAEYTSAVSEEVHAGFEAQVDQPPGLGDVSVTPGIEQRASAAERAGAEAKSRDLEAGRPEKPVFHRIAPGP